MSKQYLFTCHCTSYIDLLKFWEIQENFELNWDRFRQDYLCSKIIVDKSNQLRQKSRAVTTKVKTKKTANVHPGGSQNLC